ncbi:unnamed protein product [Bemisia tabaci]|uniref:Mitochondrial genome maintenance exonuclease 1 n=1 Tax=Bemisia tabaci TaxID=7038 RepID=A0A9P0A514_BEMTA|nr:unnamed protein product [Bemisia tabaci]
MMATVVKCFKFFTSACATTDTFPTMLVPRTFTHFFIKVHSSSKARIKAFDRMRINSENRLMYGDLLETQSERKKRLANKRETSSKSDASVEQKARGETSLSMDSNIPASVVDSNNISLKFSETLKIEPASPVDKDFKDIEKNIAQCDSSSEVKVTIETDSVTSTSQSSSGVKDNVNNLAEDPQTNTERFTFPIENADKPDLEISADTELLLGRIITKSDSLYKYPSVTKILNLTMSEASKSALFRWRNRLIAELGEEKFQEHHAKQLQLGTLFHSSLQEYLQVTPKDESVLEPELEGCWKSLERVLPRISTVKLLESHVVHEKLKYRGIIDCIAVYRNTPLIIEWKKSGKSKSSLAMTYDAPLQLSAYIGALNYDSSYPFKVSEGLVVVAYSDGAPANVFRLSPAELKHNWNAWLERYKKFTDMVEIEST